MSPWWYCNMRLPFGSPTAVDLAGVVGVLEKIGAWAGQVCVLVPPSRTASLCFDFSTEITGFEFEEIELIKSKLTSSNCNHCPAGLFLSEPLMVSRFVALLRWLDPGWDTWTKGAHSSIFSSRSDISLAIIHPRKWLLHPWTACVHLNPNKNKGTSIFWGGFVPDFPGRQRVLLRASPPCQWTLPHWHNLRICLLLDSLGRRQLLGCN